MMDGVSEDLVILYRAVSRRQGRVDYAGSITAPEALRLMQMGLARLVDVRADPDADDRHRVPAPLAGATLLTLPPASCGSPVYDFGKSLRGLAADTDTLLFISGASETSHAAATLAARAGFCCVLNVLDGRERYRALPESLDVATRMSAAAC